MSSPAAKLGRPRLSALHGNMSAYKYHGCRCPRCKQAWADYQRQRRILSQQEAIAEQRRTALALREEQAEARLQFTTTDDTASRVQDYRDWFLEQNGHYPD